MHSQFVVTICTYTITFVNAHTLFVHTSAMIVDGSFTIVHTNPMIVDGSFTIVHTNTQRNFKRELK